MSVIKTGINFYQIVFDLFRNKTFITLTILGNLTISLLSLVCLAIEKSINPQMDSAIEAIWWGYSTATTVGYGDIIPISIAGKVVGIILMLVGTSLFATFTALFAKTILEDEFFDLNNKLSPRRKTATLSELKGKKKWLEAEIKKIEEG